VHPKDNVGVSLLPISKGTSVMLDDITLTVKEDIPKGHKFALQDIKAAETISKYGFSIGKTTQDILCGEHVHSHNLKTKLVGGETYHYSEEPNAVPAVETDLTFEGYVRENGKVGIRNEVWIINTVGCVNNAAQRIALKCRIKFDGQADDFIANTHPFGCSQLGDDLSNTRNLLASLMQNPNAGGVLVIGLGCENNQLKDMLASAPEINSERVRYFNTQQVGDEVEQGMECIADLLKVMAKDKRQTVPISRLVLGMKCGGSDGFSGLTANPLVGRITDKLTQYGGKVILTETPEMFGAEQILMDRADSKNTFDKIVSLVNNFKQYFINNNQPIYENPSPGNKAGGLTTLEEKSIGAIQKGGSAIISEVIEYGEIISTRPGLTLLQSPGNDAVSSTALAAAGANIVLFTTGRGTPLGFPVPTLKISSNSEIAEFKSHWIDFNAGIIVDSKTSIDECADRLFKQIIAIASGQKTKNEINDNREIAIWKSGVTL
jgi:altronate hydrolase